MEGGPGARAQEFANRRMGVYLSLAGQAESRLLRSHCLGSRLWRVNALLLDHRRSDGQTLRGCGAG